MRHCRTLYSNDYSIYPLENTEIESAIYRNLYNLPTHRHILISSMNDFPRLLFYSFSSCDGT